MRILDARDGIEHAVMELGELDATASLLAESFSRFEPMALAVGLPHAEIRDIVMAFGPKASYKQFEFNRQQIFSSIAEPEGAVLMARDF